MLALLDRFVPGLATAKLIAAVAVGISLAFLAGTFHGAHKAILAAQKREAKLIQDQLTEVNKLNDVVRERERAHESAVTQLRTDFAAKEATERTRDAATGAALRSGDQRLRLAVVGRCPAQGAPATPSAPGADEPPRAELAPEAAAALFAIAADGDEAIRQLTGLQAYTSQLYRTCAP